MRVGMMAATLPTLSNLDKETELAYECPDPLQLAPHQRTRTEDCGGHGLEQV